MVQGRAIHTYLTKEDISKEYVRTGYRRVKETEAVTQESNSPIKFVQGNMP